MSPNLKTTYTPHALPCPLLKIPMPQEVINSINTSKNRWYAEFKLAEGFNQVHIIVMCGCVVSVDHKANDYSLCVELPEEWHVVMSKCGGTLLFECEAGTLKVTY